MLRGCWRCCAALGVAIVLNSPALAQLEKNNGVKPPKQQPTAATEQKPQTPSPAVPAAPTKDNAQGSYTPDCKSPKDVNDADLCEQQRMAKAAEETVEWTRSAAVWAKKQFWATIGEIIGLVGTIGIATAAVVVAYGANRISRESAERQLRAYVCIREAKIFWEDNRIARAVITMKNSGQTPAKNTISQTTIGIGPLKEFLSRDVSGERSRGTIGADADYTLQSRTEPLEDEIWTQIRERKLPLWVMGELSYDDIFGKERRHTYFRLRLHEKEDVFYPTYEGNDTT